MVAMVMSAVINEYELAPLACAPSAAQQASLGVNDGNDLGAVGTRVDRDCRTVAPALRAHVARRAQDPLRLVVTDDDVAMIADDDPLIRLLDDGALAAIFHPLMSLLLDLLETL